MSIPVNNCLVERSDQLVSRLNTTAFACQRTQLLPPRFDGLRPAESDQGQPAGILGNELYPHFGPSGQSQSGLAASMNRKVIFDQQPAVRLEATNNQLHELNVTGTIPTRTDQDRR